MKTHTNQYKTNIKTLGRELDSKITYTLDEEDIELGNEQLNSVSPHYEGGILKSVMKQLDIDSNVDIPLGTIINYQFGLKVGNSYEYLNFGNYVVYSSEKQEDTNSYKIIAYDKMLYAMINYENVTYTFPMTIREYIGEICNTLNIDFANENDEFVNYDKELSQDVYLDANGSFIGYTFRDVLDQLAEVTASTICINEDDELEIRYINDTEGKNLFDENYYYDNSIYLPGTYKYTKAKFKGDRILYFTAKLKEGKTAQTGVYICISESAGSPYISGTKSRYAISNGTVVGKAGYNFSGVDTLYVNIYPSNADISKIFDNYDLWVSTDNINYTPFTYDLIDEEYLKDINVNFGEKYGKVNSIVLSRSAGADNIYLRDEESVQEDGLCEIKIEDNQIMSGNDRADYLSEILEQLDGLEYYINDFSSTGITYYDLCDRYNISIGNNIYSCVMFNDEINVTQGLEELIHTDMPEQSETDYTKADKTERRINQARIEVDKQNQTITSFVSQTLQYEELNDARVLELTSKTNSVEQRITSTEASIEVMEQQIVDGQQTLRNNLVTIDINGINVSTNTSAISTLMTNDKFVIRSGDTTLAFFGYDDETNSTKAEMDNLTVTNYFISGNHRTEKMTVNGEKRTGQFFIG